MSAMRSTASGVLKGDHFSTTSSSSVRSMYAMESDDNEDEDDNRRQQEDGGDENRFVSLVDKFKHSLRVSKENRDDDYYLNDDDGSQSDQQQQSSAKKQKKQVHFDETSEALINNGASSKFEPLVTPSWTDDTIESSTPRKVCYRVAFEIISAKSTTCQRSAAPKKKFVLYSILVKRTPGLEPHPGLIERRYTDFLTLYISLRKRFRSLLNDFPFPKKTIVGNFSPEVITERSVAFQHLLALCLSVTELRRTQQFYDFLCGRELKEARRAMRVAQFEESSIVLENVYYIQEKLLLHDSEFCSSVFRTLCVLIASLNAVNNVNDAQNYAEKAIEIIKKHNLTTHAMHNELIAAFVILCKKMFWSLAEQKQFLDTTLDEMKLKAVKVDKLPTLLELVMQKDYTSSLTMQ